MNSLNTKYLKVSVGVPVYNEEKHLAELLESICLQNYPNMEVLISDNASTDDTWNIISEFVKKDKRIKAIKQEKNFGPLNNFTYLLDNSDGKYFIFAGGHDLWGEGMIDTCVDLMESDPSIILCPAQTLWINSKGEHLPRQAEFIDTRKAKSPAGRVYFFWQQISRCSSLYGLFRRDKLINNFSFPPIVGNDFYFLLNIAAIGNVVTCTKATWYRRIVREETRSDTYKRYEELFNLTNFSKRFPLIFGRIIMMTRVLTFKGSLSDRLRLYKLSLFRLFFSKEQFKILISELLRGINTPKNKMDECLVEGIDKKLPDATYLFPDKLSYKTTITQKLRNQIAQESFKYKEPRYLEVGCDRGYTLLFVEKFFVKSYGVDIDSNRLNIAQQLVRQVFADRETHLNIEFVLGTANALNEDRYDVVLIDTAHNYDNVKNDFKTVMSKNIADKYTIFIHDFGLTMDDGGVRRFMGEMFKPHEFEFAGEEKDYNPLGASIDGPEAVKIVMTKNLIERLCKIL